MARPMSLSVLGPAFLKDPEVAPQLLEAIKRLPDGQPELTIEQAWLDVHWDHPKANNIIVEIAARWDRHPEPIGDFLEVCWKHDYIGWHLLLPLIKDDELVLECLVEGIYRRFAEEGPTEEVVSSMMSLRRSGGTRATKKWARSILGTMINNALSVPDLPPIGLFVLWWTYKPNDVEPAALRRLEALMVPGTPYAIWGTCIATGLPLSSVCTMLGKLAYLARGPTSAAMRNARRLILATSGSAGHCVDVARALEKTPWREYMTRLDPKTQWHIVPYMRDNRAIATMATLYNRDTDHAIRQGLFARIMECDPSEEEMLQLEWAAPIDVGTGAETALHWMHVWGRLPHCQVPHFHEALVAYPKAVKAIARKHEWVAKEMTWARRKMLLCCMAASQDNQGMTHKKAKEAKEAKEGTEGTEGTDCVLEMLAKHQCIWHAVVAFM